MHEYASRVLDVIRSPRALLAGLAVVAIFGLSIWASPLVAAVVVGPLALVATVAAAPGQARARSRESERALVNAGLSRHTQHGRKISILDPETALLQRWYFELRVSDEARRCRRYGMTMSMLFIQIEDDAAHARDPDWPTEVQTDMVQVLDRQMRAVDLASRTGLREFALCLPHTGEEGATSLAWRIWQNAGSYKITLRKASSPDQGLDFDALYEAAQEFTPADPAPKPIVEPSSHLQLVQLVQSSPYGEVALEDGQTPSSAKSKLRRASKRAGVDLRIWEANGAIHFERVHSNHDQSGIA